MAVTNRVSQEGNICTASNKGAVKYDFRTGMAETVRLEEFTGVLQGRLVVAWQTADAAVPWLPTEFMPAAYVSRILITGRVAALSTALTADPSWTQTWRSPGGKEWSCLLGVIPHLPGPMLLVVGPDIVLSPKLVSSLKGAADAGATVIILRSVASGMPSWPVGADVIGPDQVFLPILSGGAASAILMAVFNEWAARTVPRLDPKGLLPQLAAQGYGLTVTGGRWYWYRPSESVGTATLSVAQVARQLLILGNLLERVGTV